MGDGKLEQCSGNFYETCQHTFGNYGFQKKLNDMGDLIQNDVVERSQTIKSAVEKQDSEPNLTQESQHRPKVEYIQSGEDHKLETVEIHWSHWDRLVDAN